MSKIMCDVCGTVFQDSTGNCPICGWIPPAFRAVKEQSSDDFDFEDIPVPENNDRDEEAPVSKGRLLLTDFQEMMGRLRRDDSEQEDTEQAEPASQFSSPLVIVLLLIIVLLLLSTGYLFFRYYLPNRGPAAAVTVPVETTFETEPTTEETTTIPTVPCTALVLTSEPARLGAKGQNWLIHVKILPEDSTDEILFISEDESVATVTADGRVTAVGEGTTSVVITCGSQLIRSKVTVNFSMEPTEVPATLVTAVSSEDETQTSAPTAAQATTQATTAAAEITTEATTEATTAATTEATTEATTAASSEAASAPTETKPDITLKLKRHDVSTNKGLYITLALDCDLAADEVQWSTDDPTIATVQNGQVQALNKKGSATITVTYGDQKDSCIVRVR